MRRGLASVVMGLSLLLASASWAGFILSRTVLDPGRSERLADTLLENEDVREVIVNRLADSVETQIPADVPVTRETIETAADIALDDPRVEAFFRDGIVQAHQNALEGNDDPIMIDATALGAAGRDAVVAQRPELDAVLPVAPAVEVELPSTGLAFLGTIKRNVDRYTLIGAVVSVLGMVLAFVLARNRAAALRRVAFWAFGAAFFWVAVAYAVPWVLGRIAPSSVSIAMAAIDVFFSAMIRPAVTLGVIGVVLLLVSFVWPAIERRRPAAKLDRAAPDARSLPARGASPVRTAAPVVRTAAAAQPFSQAPTPIPAATPIPAPPPASTPQPVAAAPVVPSDRDATAPYPQIISDHRPPEPPQPAPYYSASPQPAVPPQAVPPQAMPPQAVPHQAVPPREVPPLPPAQATVIASTHPTDQPTVQAPAAQPLHHSPAQSPAQSPGQALGQTIPAAVPMRPSAQPIEDDGSDPHDLDDPSEWVEGRGYADDDPGGFDRLT